MLETLLGGLVGGVLRVVPEVMSFLDKKNERAHEIEMFGLHLDADKLRGEQAIKEGELQQETTRIAGGMQALMEGIKAQGQLTGVRWVDGMNQTVRPLVTYILLTLYVSAKCATMYMLFHDGMALPQILQNSYGESDVAMLSGCINFFFLNRIFDKQRG